MKKNKLLIPLISLAGLGTLATPLITSCSNGGGNTPTSEITVTALEDYSSIIGNAYETTIYFQLSSAIADNSKIEVNVKQDSQFTFELKKIYNNSFIAVTATKKNRDDQRYIEEKIDFEFTCKDSAGTTSWTKTVTQYPVYYTTVLNIDADKRTAEGVYDKTTSICSHTYEFDLDANMDVNKIDMKIINSDSATADAYLMQQPTIENNKMYIKIGIKQKTAQALVAGVSKAEFNLHFNYLDESGESLYAPLTLKGFSLKYFNDRKIIEKKYLQWSGHVITGINLTTQQIIDGGYNTLAIPSKDEHGAYFTIADDAFYKDGASIFPESLITLSFDGIGCIGIGERAFKGAHFTTVDISAYPDSVSGYESMFGTESLAFATAQTTGQQGTIIWNKNFSWLKKHQIKPYLYNAGIISNGWYDSTIVKNESELRQAAWMGGNIVLNQDITLSSPLEFERTTAILDLNGKTLTESRVFYDESKKIDAVVGVYNASVIVCDMVGTGTIKALKPSSGKSDYAITARCDVIGKDSTILQIQGGTYIGNKAVINNYNADVHIEDSSITSGGVTKKYKSNFKINAESERTTGVRFLLQCSGNYATRTKYYIYGGNYYDATNSFDDKKLKEFNPSECYPYSLDEYQNWVQDAYVTGKPTHDDTNKCWVVTPNY